ncbi:hypothetical protein SteCoe_25303 [Stentor coeruleus]|uniref:Poly(A) RNA polymerase mitochondrial-like central palm domain-containing protein n=1 Tax=Stentor coeruleus TaxID=5963 RepID=A0A1R2BFW2_9CILI|nr:hypothetical protein SteCoe_25303 [Stentor coeruleus]
MHIHKYYNGHIEFSLLNKIDKRTSEIELKSIFACKKVSLSKCKTLMEEEKIEKSLRFSDCEEYCDSISLEKDLTQMPIELLKLFDMISGGQCFKSACKAYWDNGLKQWGFEYPRWLDPYALNSIARWACADFERSVWMSYYKAHGQDPRATGETKDLGLKDLPEVVPESLVSIENTFFSVKKTESLEIFPVYEKQKDIFIEVMTKLRSITNIQICDFYGPPSCDMYKTKDSCHNFQNPKSLEMFQAKLLESDDKVVEFMFFSPIHRVCSMLDVVLKLFGMKIRDLYNQKLMEELIIQENYVKDQEMQKKSTKKPKPTKTHNSKTPKTIIQQNTPKKTLRNDHKDIIEACKIVTKDLVDKIFTNLYTSLAEEHKFPNNSNPKTDDGEFLIVSQRKNKRPQIQQKTAAYSLESTKPNLSQRGKTGTKKKLNSSAKPKKSNFLWEKSHNPPIPTTNEADFPTLSQAINALHVLSKKNLPKEKLSIVLTSENQDTLHNEIYNFVTNTLKKIQDKSKSIQAMLEKINNIVSELLGGYIHIYGSYATGLAIESSDIDLAILGVDLHSRQLVQTACIQLASALKQLPFVVSVNAIITAKIPVIKLQTDLKYFSGIQSYEMIDITFIDTFEGSHLGIEAITFTKNLLSVFPDMLFLAIVLKNFLYSINLNSAYHGGLSSYSLVLWIAALFNSMNVVSSDLGELLECFLDFFGNKFNPKEYGINVVNRGHVFLLTQGGCEYAEIGGYERYAVTVDPINHMNNTTRTSYRINEVLQEFSNAHTRLKEIRNKGKKRPTLKQIFKKFNR